VNQFCRESRETLFTAFSTTAFYDDVLTVDPAQIA